METPSTRRRRAVRDRWLRRLRRVSVAVPAAAALAGLGLTAMFARHDALTTTPTATARGGTHTAGSQPGATTSARPRSDGEMEGADDDGQGRALPGRTVPSPSPTLTPGGTQPPITHTGGS